MTQPSLRRFDGSFESWAYHRGMLRKIQRLEQEAYLERRPGGSADRLYRLTDKGRIAALGGIDPTQEWSRPWDGVWHLLMFDLPTKPRGPRVALRRTLRTHRLGCLQGSVWICPDPLDAFRASLKGDRHPASLLLFDGNPSGGEKPHEIVQEAWDWDRIGEAWANYQQVISEGRHYLNIEHREAESFRHWSRREFEAWKQVCNLDPFLPKKLLPPRYPGIKIWRSRNNLMSRLTEACHKRGLTTAT